MALNLQQCRDLWYAILREDEQDSSSYPTVLMDMLINAGQLSICSWLLINPNPKIASLSIVSKGVLPFLRKTKFYNTIGATTITESVDLTDTIIQVWDTSAYPSSWTLFINWNIVTYTSKTSLQFEWCTWIEYTHKAWTQVYYAYDLPTDYMSTINVIYDSKLQLKSQVYDDIYEWQNGNASYITSQNISTNWIIWMFSSPFYSLIDNKYIVVFWINVSGLSLMLRYEKKPTKLVNTTDLLTIDNEEFSWPAILYLQIWEMLFNRGEEARGAELINNGMAWVRKLYNFYNNQSYESQNGQRVSSDKSGKYFNI